MTNYLCLSVNTILLQENLGSKMQFSVDERWETEISWICIFKTKKISLFPLVRSIPGALLNWGVTISMVKFGDPQMSLIWQQVLQLWFTYISGGHSTAEKKSMKMRPEIWKMCNGVWVGCSKSWICCSLSLFTDQNCL